MSYDNPYMDYGDMVSEAHSEYESWWNCQCPACRDMNIYEYFSETYAKQHHVAKSAKPQSIDLTCPACGAALEIVVDYEDEEWGMIDLCPKEKGHKNGM